MHLLRIFFTLDKNPWVIEAAQNPLGKLLLFVCAVLIFSIESHDLLQAVLFLGMSFTYAYIPRYKDLLLLLFTQCLGLYRIAFSPNDLHSDIAKVMAQEHFSQVPAWQLALLIYGLYLLLAWGTLIYVRQRPDSLAARRPILLLILGAFALLFLSSGGLMDGAWRVLIWSFLIIYCAYMWFFAYALIDQSSRTRSSDSMQLGMFHPFWGSTTLPYGKGAALLRKTRATSGHELAVTQIKGFKLLVWAILMLALDAALKYGFENYLHVHSIEYEMDAYLSHAPQTRLWQWLSLIWSQIDFVLWFSMWGNMVIATARFAGFRLPRSTWRPLESRTLIEYFNRIIYYFKELMVDLFFTPTFLTCFKKHPRFRMFFATFMAAGIGNALYHFFRDVSLAADLGIQELFLSFSSYAFYCAVLATGIGLSQVRMSHGYRPSSTRLGRLQAFLCVWGFVTILQIFGDETRSHTLGERFHYLFYLFGIET
jgi:hypothetical protein